ncbi:sensor histidine kinase [Dysgonomonas sp. ZJ279]|uniref:sensor histidine kinase n=1 Tax=Dysgonomonas sp. ZJ279 TaxID=2709796 RepID=UPI0013EC9A78|nr:histidine kinase [Dysgonomonas sp. ZJ279]
MRFPYRWLYPFFLGLVIFNTLRAVTDLTKNGTFWIGSIRLHIIGQIAVIIMCYFFDRRMRKRLQRRKYIAEKKQSSPKEYGIIFLTSAIHINIVLVIGQYIGIFHMGDGIIDYMLINVVFLPLLLIYYAIISTDVMNKNYNEQVLQLEKVKNQQLETELNFLKAQYHPHFLFNALNTVYFQIDEENKQAKYTVELLSELLRYQLYNVQQKVQVSEEIIYLNAYIELQRIRMSERLVLKTNFDTELAEQKIHPLLFQPLLENAFKYVDGEYWINVDLKLENNKIRFIVGNSISTEIISNPKNKGIGLENLSRKLELLYSDKQTLRIEQKEDSFSVELIIELD